MPEQGRIGDPAKVNSDAHGCPKCPHPGYGPATVGSPDVLVNGLPAVRVTDVGVHAVCCGSNQWQATEGSSTVFINSLAAHRKGDGTQHCGGTGKLDIGSADVLVGDSGSGGGGGGGSSGGGGGGGGSSGFAQGGEQDDAITGRIEDAGDGSASGDDDAGAEDSGAGGDTDADASGGDDSGAGDDGGAGDDVGAGSDSGGGDDSSDDEQPQVGVPIDTGDDSDEDASSDDDPIDWYEVELLDDLLAPIPGVPIELSVPGGSHELTTDGSGLVRVEAPAGTAGAHVADTDKLAEVVTPRWEQPNGAEPPESDDTTRVAEVKPLGTWVGIEPKVRFTLVAVPFYECFAAPGGCFEFDSSFPGPEVEGSLDDAVDALREEDRRKMMLFGHSDPTGADPYNKGLSEHRGQAVYALLTHQPEHWETLWHQDHWYLKPYVIRHLLTVAGYPVSPGGSDAEVSKQWTAFQQDNGIAPTYSITGPENKQTRELLFLAYMKAMHPEPVEDARIVSTPAGSNKWMGCGENNPLDTAEPHAPSRRVTMVVGDPAAIPVTPCRNDDLGPCQGERDDGPGPEHTPHFRCKAFRKVTQRCHCKGVGLPPDEWEVAVQVQNEKGDNLSDVQVEVSQGAEEPFLRATTDDEGVVRAAVEEPGSYEAKVVDKIEGLEFQASDQNPEWPLKNADITVVDGEGQTFSYQTDEEGAFEVGEMAAGEIAFIYEDHELKRLVDSRFKKSMKLLFRPPEPEPSDPYYEVSEE